MKRNAPARDSGKHDHRKCVHTALSTAEAVCKARGEKLTPVRKRVLELVWASHRPVGAYALLDSLRADGRSAAPPTVYRALEFLLALGLVHRVESLNAYLGCAHPASDHAAQFLICRQCGTAAELEESDIATAIDRHAKRAGFAVERRTVEAMGLCAACQTA
jgi:Fur family transcriptional regulator, zinc uptake regulator